MNAPITLPNQEDIPTVPEDQMITVSWSEIDSARHCGLKHHLQYQRRWTHVVPPGGARAIGTPWHTLMHVHYRTLKEIQQEIREGKWPGLVTPVPRSGKAWVYPDETADRIHQAIHDPEGLAAGILEGPDGELFDWMYAGYLQRWGLNIDWTILAVEYKSSAILPNPSGGPSRFRLKGTKDLVIQSVWDGTIRLVDHKSGKRRPAAQAFGLMDQFGLYEWILWANNRKVAGSYLSYTKTERPKKPNTLQERFEHFPLDHTDAELVEIAADAYRTAEDAYSYDPQANGGFRVYPDAEWCARRCDFRNAHLAARRGFIDLEQYLAGTGFERRTTRH